MPPTAMSITSAIVPASVSAAPAYISRTAISSGRGGARSGDAASLSRLLPLARSRFVPVTSASLPGLSRRAGLVSVQPDRVCGVAGRPWLDVGQADAAGVPEACGHEVPVDVPPSLNRVVERPHVPPHDHPADIQRP